MKGSTGGGCAALVSLPLGTEGAGRTEAARLLSPGSPGERRWGKETDEHNLVWKLAHVNVKQFQVLADSSPVNSASVVILTLQTLLVFPSEATGPAHGRRLHRGRMRFRTGLSRSQGETGQNCVIVSW